MDNAIFSFPKPINEPVKAYAPGSSEKSSLKKALAQLSSEEWDIPLVIGGKEIRTGNTGKVVMPHDHHHVLATYHKAGEKEVQMAIDAAMKAHKEWSELPWVERASVMLRVAELLSTKYRYILNASVMLGQSKNPFQAEIDAPCELIDFLRFSTFYASQVYADQPYSETGILNRMEYRALEGFVFSLTPFNFTSIASNLNMAPAMMGNVAVWKPSTTAIHSNYFLMKVFREAGLPDGVVNSDDERMALRQHLIQNRIYPAILWKVPEDSCFSDALDFSNRMLSVHCDARYNRQQIEEMCSLINKYYD